MITTDTEKITINMSAVDLGKVDLLIQEGIYSNRTDFIRTAIRLQLDKHNLEIQQSVIRHSCVIGALIYDKKDFERHKLKGEKIKMTVVRLLRLADDISPRSGARGGRIHSGTRHLSGIRSGKRSTG